MNSTSDLPLVSVIVPAYNHAPFLRERIGSILEQDYDNLELILLDDCSTDNSAEVLRQYEGHPKVKNIMLNSRNSGSTFAQWKKGMARAEGKYVWIAESDDSAAPQFLTELVSRLEEHPSAVLAFSGSLMIDSEGKEIAGMDWDRWETGDSTVEVRSARDLIASHLLFTSNIYNASQVVMRRDAIPNIDESQARMRYCGDWLFWVNLLAQGGEGIIVRKKLNRFRQHDCKVSPNASRSGLYFLEGIPIMTRVADVLCLNDYQRRVLAGRTLKRLKKFPQLVAEKEETLNHLLSELSRGTTVKSKRPIFLYQLDKVITHRSGLQFKSLGNNQ